jgi:PKD repeat protein
MKRTVTAAILLVTLAVGAASAEQPLPVDPQRYLDRPSLIGYVPDEVIVVLKDNVAVDHRRDMRVGIALSNLNGFDALAQQFEVERIRPQFPGSDRSGGAALTEANKLARHYKVRFKNGDLDEVVAAYEALPDVDHVERIGIHTVFATPNDTYYDNPPPTFPYDQWHYWDTYGINADSAWDLDAGDQAVIVGDLDIGTMYDHGDLGGSNPPGPNDASTNGNIWVNTNEIPGNGVDDDGNGYVDDIIGWDFVERTDWYSYQCIDIDCGGADNDPSDGEGHGTHTAGTIAAITNNGYAVAGVAGGFGDGTFSGGGNGVKIVPCRIGYVLDYFIYGPTGVVIMDYVAEAMYYMAQLKIAGWNVAAINCSFGSSNTGGLAAAASYLIAQDVVICVAAGNSSSSSPAYLNSRGDCLDVGATDQSGNPASFTNYGSWVDIAAPGVGVLSTITDPTNPGVDYVAVMDGTSMACPHVAGVVGLLESFDPSLSAADKIAIITDPDNTKPYGGTRYIGAGIIDARKCLNAVGGGCDLAADFSGSPTSGCTPLTVNFTDLSTGTGIDGWSWTFGDGGSSTAQNPSYTYNSPGTYTVSLTAASSSQSCYDTQTKIAYITVGQAPTAAFLGAPPTGEAPLMVFFVDQSTGNPTSWSWDFGDGVGTSTAQNPSYTYDTPGTYTVTLTATNSCGSDDEIKVDYISVAAPGDPPVADFTGSPTSGQAPLTVNFTDQSANNPTAWSWDFGDGIGTSGLQNPQYTYDTPGSYTVTLFASNEYGSDTAIKVDYITVAAPQDPPVADFTGSPTSGTAPLTVQFTDQSSNNPTSWSWDFGDGVGASAVQNPQYTYETAGSYTVSMTATNEYGSDTETKIDYITVTEGPQVSQVYPMADVPVAGTVSGSYLDLNGSDNVYESITEVLYTGHPRKTYSYLEHKWTFNLGAGGSSMMFYLEGYRTNNADGDDFVFAYSTDDATYYNMVTVASSTEQVYSYSMPAGLTGTVYVRVMDMDRNWGQVSLDPVYVDEMYFEYSSQPSAPMADFVADPTSGVVPLTVQFTDASWGDPTSWSWDFGDGGGTSAAQNPSYTYQNTGTYTVSLTATNTYGSDTETKLDYITVVAAGQSMHVSNITVSRKTAGPNCSGQGYVTVVDGNGQPVANATVYTLATGPVSGNYSDVTDASGVASMETGKTKNCAGEWCFEVTDVTHSSYTYDPADNAVTKACESGWVYGEGGDYLSLEDEVPQEFNLGNHPNPFNPTTDISFTLPEPSYVTLTIYNVVGQQVITLVDGYRTAGPHTVTWSGRSANGEAVSSGIYFYRLEAGEKAISKKMLLLK